MTLKDYLNENDLFAADAGASIVEVREGYSRAVMKVVKGHLNAVWRLSGWGTFYSCRFGFGGCYE